MNRKSLEIVDLETIVYTGYDPRNGSHWEFDTPPEVQLQIAGFAESGEAAKH